MNQTDKIFGLSLSSILTLLYPRQQSWDVKKKDGLTSRLLFTVSWSAIGIVQLICGNIFEDSYHVAPVAPHPNTHFSPNPNSPSAPLDSSLVPRPAHNHQYPFFFVVEALSRYEFFLITLVTPSLKDVVIAESWFASFKYFYFFKGGSIFLHWDIWCNHVSSCLKKFWNKFGSISLILSTPPFV